MRIDEQPEFDKELNALMEKYRIAVISGVYLSKLGVGEQVGVFGGCRSKVPQHIQDLATLTGKQHKIFIEWDV